MRTKTILLSSIALATALGTGAALRAYLARPGGGGSGAGRARVVETGPLYRFAAEAPGREKVAEPVASIALTASDGTGLALASLDARGVVEGPLAFTEIRLVFENPDDRALEGTFRIALPQGAAVSRFAMKVNERWQEGEVVETQAARRAYEDFLHRKQDPALLEQAAGNEFSARVFPIPARGRKELIVSYSQELTPASPYVVPLRGLPRVGRVDAVVAGAGDDAPLAGQVHLEGAAPAHDLVVEASKLPPGDGVRAGELALLRVRPPAGAGPDPVASALVLVDTSASRALGFEAQIELLAGVAAGLGGARLAVAAFDQGVDVIYEGPASGFAQQGPARLRERQAFGASDLEGALAWAASRAAPGDRVVLLTDGVPTLGATEPAALARAAAALRGAGAARLDVLAVGGIRDDALLRSLCAAGLPRDGVVVDGAAGAERALRRLSSSALRADVKVEGAEWQWPERLEGLQPGDEALVYAKLPANVTPRLVVGGAASTPKLREVDRPLLERAWVGAKLAQLVQKPPPGQTEEAVRDEIVRLSTAFRVLSPHTALLVLETEQDYARFKIDRRALADILGVEGTRLVRQKRGEDALAPAAIGAGAKPAPAGEGVVLKAPPPPPDAGRAGRAKREAAREAEPEAPRAEGGVGTRAKGEEGSVGRPAEIAAAPAAGPAEAASAAPPGGALAAPWGRDIGESFGAGGLGLRGAGKSGGGRGEGIGLGNVGAIGHGTGRGAGKGNASRVGDGAGGPSQVRVGAMQVSGGLPPEIIQRVVRQQFGRFRLCYERARQQDPHLTGRVAARLVVAPDGSVTSVSNGGSDLPSPAAVACVLQAFERLSFPAPEGGGVQVVVPLFFTPGSGPPPAGLPTADPLAPPEPRRPAPPAPVPASFGPYAGKLATVMEALAKGDRPEALRQAIAFRAESPGDVLALVALGEAFEAVGEARSAARAYGSIVDLFSSRADLRRMAGGRLERLDAPYAHALAADGYAKAVAQRPDHPSSHRMLAYARLRAGDPAGAFEAIERGAKRAYPEGRFRGVDRILREDAGLIGAAWAKAEPSERAAIERRLGALGAAPEREPSLRFVLSWETDANDVDFHIYDARGGHAFYSQKELPSGGELYADVTTGYGPECFTVRRPPGERAGPYRLQAHYYSRGPMGYGMGKLEIVEHDGEGGLRFEQRPFVIMHDRAFVDLGTYPAGAKAPPVGAPELPRP